MNTTALEIPFPLGGIVKRLDYTKQPPMTCHDAINVYSDGMRTGRERGGMRPALAKAFALQLGSGAKPRLLNSLRFVNSSDELVARLLASANGVFYREQPVGTMESVTSTLTLASDRRLSSVDYFQDLLIADNGSIIEEGTDGVIGGGSSNQLTSTQAGDFAAGGVNDDDQFVVFLSHTAINEVQTVTIDATGGEFLLRDPEANVTTDLIAENAAASAVEDALEAVYGTGNVAVTGSAGGPYTVTFQGDLAGQRVALMEADADYLTGGAGTAVIARTTRGATTTQYAGTYNITTVATTTVTIHKTLQALTGVTFYVTRCPKKYNGTANTLSKWIQDDYTLAEAIELGQPELEGEPKGAIPVTCTGVTQYNNRAVMWGGLDPHVVHFSRIGDEDDWDVSQTDVARAVSGTVDATARINEPVVTCIPHQHSCMLVFGKTSVSVLRGDITSGGFQNLSDHVGMVSDRAYCVTPEGAIFWLSLDGVYVMTNPCGGKPQSVSREVLPEELLNVDTTSYTVSMAYCTRYRMIELWLTANSGTEPSYHWLMDYKLNLHGDGGALAFWKMLLADVDFEPFITHERRDVASSYSVVIHGCRDGYLRHFRHDIAQDDSMDFDSEVSVGPIALGGDQNLAEGIINEFKLSAPDIGNHLDIEIRTGRTPEEALDDDQPFCDSFGTGLSNSSYVRKGGVCAFIKFSGREHDTRWEFSKALMTVSPGGRAR